MIVQSLLGGSSAGDQYSSYVVSLLHFNGTNGSTTITDEVTKTWTASGNTQLTTSFYQFATAGVTFDGSFDIITGQPADASLFDLAHASSTNYTIEGWFYPRSPSADRGIVCKHGAAPGGYQWALYLDAATKLIWRVWDGTNVILTLTGSACASGVWYSFAVCKTGNNYELFINGTSVATGTQSGTPGGAGEPVQFGIVGGTSWYYFGYMDEFRFTRGVARYTANYTPAAVQFPYP